MRLMGELSGVPIEPPKQTSLLDACMAQEGVLAGGVPGGELATRGSGTMSDNL
jgi:phosphomevalonate kinase